MVAFLIEIALAIECPENSDDVNGTCICTSPRVLNDLTNECVCPGALQYFEITNTCECPENST
jgi:hypothetical protein